MKLKTAILLVLSMASAITYAQTDKEEKAEKQAESKAHAKEKADYNVFHRQILALKEFSEERRKIPALQKANKTTIKVLAIVDTSDEDTKSKTLTGYIVQNIGDNSVNLYEVVFDRAEKKIVSVKHTAEAADAEKADKEDQAEEKKTPAKKATKKKSKDDDDEDDDEKPTKEKDDDKD